MLIEEPHKDVPTKADGDGNMRIFLFHPKIPNYPHARFPAVVLFSEIYQGGWACCIFCSFFIFLIPTIMQEEEDEEKRR